MDGVGMSRAEVLNALAYTRAEEAIGPRAPAQRTGDTGAFQDAEEAGSDVDSWMDLYRVLAVSLRSSSKQFQSLTLETLALGWMCLSQEHAGVADDVEGQCLTEQDSDAVHQLLHFAQWAAAFNSGPNVTDVATWLSIPEENVVAYKPHSSPLAPAFFIAVETSRPTINIVVRGTSTWHDAFTDIIAHTSPLAHGHAHSGMLASARALADAQIGLLRQLLEEQPGAHIHCVGHSLGGGVAALLAFLLRMPQYQSQLPGVGLVLATTYGTPPVVTAELAQEAAAFVRTVVHNADVVPRMSLASLRDFQHELEAGRDTMYQTSGVLSWLRDSDVMRSAQNMATSLASSWALPENVAHHASAAMSKDPATQRVLSATFQAGASFLSAKLRRLHMQAVGEGQALVGKHAQPGAHRTPSQLEGPTSSSLPNAGRSSQGVVAELHLSNAQGNADNMPGTDPRGRCMDLEQADAMRLCCPGRLYYLERTGIAGRLFTVNR